MKIKGLIIFILIMSRNVYAGYTYTYSSDFTHQVNLDNTHNSYPVSGTKYENAFNSNRHYECFCDLPDNQKSETYFKATYSHGDNVDEKGYMILNDFIKVKTYIFIANHGDMSVPFTDVSNNFQSSCNNKKDHFNSGSKGKVEIIIRKSILNGHINIPEFYVNLYARTKFTNKFSDKPISTVHFNPYTLHIKKICDVKNTPFEKVIKNVTIQDAIGHKKMFDGFDVEIACEKDLSDSNLKLAFIGKRFSNNADFFASDKNASFGIGLWNKKENKFINESSPYSVKVINKKETIPFSVVPHLVKSEDYFDSNNIEFSLSTYLYSDE